MPRTLSTRTLTGSLFVLLLLSQASAENAETRGDHRATHGRDLLNRLPASVEEAESRRTDVRRWLVERLGQVGQQKNVALRTLAQSTQENCLLETLSWSDVAGEAACHLLVPAGHRGRGPAVMYFGPHRASSKNPRFRVSPLEHSLPADAVALARAGYIVLVASVEASPARDLAACRYLLDRREVDPERVAVWGSEGTLRRAWSVAAMDERVAAAVSLAGNDERLTDDDLESRAMLSLIAPRPHRLLASAGPIGPGDSPPVFDFIDALYGVYDVPALFHVTLSKEADRGPSPAVKAEILRWLREEL